MIVMLAQAALFLTVGDGAITADQRVAPVVLSEAVGGGILSEQIVPDLSMEQHLLIQQAIDENLSAIESMGKLPALSLTVPSLGWPLRPNNGLNDFGYHGTVNFVDLDPAFPDHLLDYACGSRTYDRADGYNHAGIDYLLWPFSWNKMDQELVAIVAAAPGTIVFKHDGEYDRSCGFNNNQWNVVVVRHADGSVAWYGHMKNGSLTAKPVGDAVAQGEYLGLVGSSGNSTAPHLHFELHDSAGRVIDPHEGPCNRSSSWWVSQRPYYDSAINKLTSGFAVPVPFSACNSPEQPNEATDFAPHSVVYLTAYYRDQRGAALDPTGAATRFSIYFPDGTLATQWTQSSPVDYYAVSYWYVGLFLPQNVETGVYRWEAVYHGISYNHYFTVSSDEGRYYARCINACDASRQSCDSSCVEGCRDQTGPCVDACKSVCIDQEKDCKDACQEKKVGSLPSIFPDVCVS